MQRMLRNNRFFLLALLLAYSAGVFAQQHPGTQTAPGSTSKSAGNSKTQQPVHRFWDKENIGLFAGVGAARMLDYASTRHLRDQGDNEILLTNAIVDNRPLFVCIELAGTAASIGVSYAFHRTGHHTLERWVSIGHIGVGVGGSIHNYALKPVPMSPTALTPGLKVSFAR
jgi:hypothetical protein